MESLERTGLWIGRVRNAEEQTKTTARNDCCDWLSARNSFHLHVCRHEKVKKKFSFSTDLFIYCHLVPKAKMLSTRSEKKSQESQQFTLLWIVLEKMAYTRISCFCGHFFNSLKILNLSIGFLPMLY